MKEWQIAVTLGPHAAPDFLTEEGLDEFLSAVWKVSPRSNRTGIRLDGPIPKWARSDGGEAGLHPQISTIMAMPSAPWILPAIRRSFLAPMGPAVVVCLPVVIPLGERWKMGQVRPGDAIRWR